MIRRPLLAVALFAALAPLAAGCSSDPMLARVGDRAIRRSEFLRVGRGQEMQYPGSPDAAKRDLLNDLVRRALMLEVAHREGLDTTQAVRNIRADTERRALLQALYRQLASPDQRASEAEAREMWAWRQVEVPAKVLYATDGHRAQLAAAAIRGGMSFGDAILRYGVPGATAPDGSIGTVSPGSLLEPLDRELLRLRPGELGGPYETPQGWFLLEIGARTTRTSLPYALQATAMRDLVRQRKQRAALARSLADLRRAYELEVEPGASQALYAQLGGGGQPPPLAAGVLDAPLARYRDGRYTMGDALQDLRRADTPRPPANMLQGVEAWIQAQAMTRIGLAEARRRHLDEDPDLRRFVDNTADNSLLNIVYQRATAGVSAPDSAQVREAWSRVQSRYLRLRQARIAWVDLPDSAAAAALAAHGAHAGSLADGVRMAGLTADVHEETIAFPSQDPSWASLEPLLLQFQSGEWAGPQRTPQGWRVLAMIDKVAFVPELSTLPAEVQQNVTALASDLAREARFRAYTDSLGAALRPELHPERLAGIPWPVPLLDESAR